MDKYRFTRPPRTLPRFNKYPPINFLSPFSGFLSSFSILLLLRSCLLYLLLPPPHHPSPPLVVGAGQRNYFIRGRPLICPRVYFALVKRRRHTLYATPLPPLALYNRPLPALVCISLTLTLRPILFAVSSISTTRRGIGAVDAG